MEIFIPLQKIIAMLYQSGYLSLEVNLEVQVSRSILEINLWEGATPFIASRCVDPYLPNSTKMSLKLQDHVYAFLFKFLFCSKTPSPKTSKNDFKTSSENIMIFIPICCSISNGFGTWRKIDQCSPIAFAI